MGRLSEWCGWASSEERMAKVEGIPEQMDRRLNHIESRLSWTLGTMITMWLTR